MDAALKSRALTAYRTAYLAAPGDDDARDQAGFAAIEAAFPELDIYDQLDLLQYAQEAMGVEMAAERRAA